MNPDELRQVWQAQAARSRLVIDADRLLAEVRRNDRWFAATIFWRDAREVAVSLLLVPVWVVMGVAAGLPWTWYLTIPALLWIAGFMLVDRLRHHRRAPEPGEPLVVCVEHSLVHVEHQIWLLRNVFWWYLLPFTISMLAFVGHVAWRDYSAGRFGALPLVNAVVVVAVVAAVFAGIYWLNQLAVTTTLETRRQELQALLASLREAQADTGELAE